MGTIQVNPDALQGPANVYGRASFELTSRIAGTFSSAANLSGDAFGNPGADSAYSEAQHQVANSLPATGDALMAMARTIASAAGGYLAWDQTSANSLTGLPSGITSNPMRAPGVPSEYPLVPNTANYTDRSYHIVPGTPGK
jgi:uncharacterized protein YukE